MPFGVASSPAIFQRLIESVLLDISRVLFYIDDILITGANTSEQLQNIEKVLKQLAAYGIKAKMDKFAFLKDSLEFLGHVIDKEGIHTSPMMVKAIEQAPISQN